MAGVRLHMKPGWHTYWRDPGDSGIPTKIAWHLAPGITAGEIQWPLPKRLSEEDVTTYIYENEVVLIVPLKISADAAKGPFDLNATISWLECEKQCVPGSGDVHAALKVGDATTPSTDATVIASWQTRVPSTSPTLAVNAWWEKPPVNDLRPLVFEISGLTNLADADFYPYDSDSYSVQPGSKLLSTAAGKLRFEKMVKKTDGDWTNQIAGLLLQKTDGATLAATEIKTSIAQNAPSGVTVPAAKPDQTVAVVVPKSLLMILFYAFIGGLILNVMPCVLPVIALKILGFVQQAKTNPRRVRAFGLVYALGVLASFVALAALVILVKSLGHAASWGMQFQSPQFLVVMTALVSLVALNLFGVFEINLSGKVMGSAGELASHDGMMGAFLNGVLATILATPCTAPFLGAALGFAFTQPALVTVMVFLMVGIGLAAPYVILSWEPAWLKFLPKPGVWMEHFKVAMGFPMLATAIWLFTLAAPNFGDDGELFLGLFLVWLALIAWIWGQFVQRSHGRTAVAMFCFFALLAFGYAYFLEHQLDWRHPVSAANGTLNNSPDGIAWQPWSPEAVDAARTNGRPVIVDFTAKWCLVCQVNKKTSLEIPEVRSKLKAINAVALIENSPAKDATVVAELNRYERAGVPLVLVYPKNPKLPPQVLPEILTPSIVLHALDEAAKD